MAGLIATLGMLSRPTPIFVPELLREVPTIAAYSEVASSVPCGVRHQHGAPN